MYLSIIDKPTDEELVKYPSVHLTCFHEWDPSVLDYSHSEGDGEPVQVCDPQHIDLIDPNFDTHGLYTKRAINTLSSLADVQQNSHGFIFTQVYHSSQQASCEVRNT